MISLKDKIKQQRSVKDVTLNNYVRNITNVIKKYKSISISNNYNPVYLTYFEDAEEFISWLSNINLAEATKYSYLLAVIILLSLDKKEYSNELEMYRVAYKQIGLSLENQPKNQDEMAQWTTMKSLIKKTKELGQDISSFKKYRNYIIAALHTMQEPRRNIARTIIFTKTNPHQKTKQNYLVLNRQSYFLYGNQKVAKYNDEVVSINKNLQKILQDYIQTFNIKPGDLLLPAKENTNIELSTGAYTKILKTRLGVSASMIRKIYVSENMSPQIKSMGNSTQTQYKHYFKK
tara:strand:+ start:47 stop:916 length:870 start_codon:yes stop_codon:yes gene_type:complete